MHSDISPIQFVIPGLTKPAPYLIRGNLLVPHLRGDDVWISGFAGMTPFAAINVAVCIWRELSFYIWYAVCGIDFRGEKLGLSTLESNWFCHIAICTQVAGNVAKIVASFLLSSDRKFQDT